VSNDFTVLGASSAVINGKKIRHVKETATARGMPLVFLGESSGARMPDRMGAAGRAILGQDRYEYRRRRETPWISANLGACYGSSTWYACLSDFVVMRKGAAMSVASPRVTEVAIRQPVDPEELGGWRLHTDTTGLVDLAVGSDEEALLAVRRFMSYLPSHNGALAPRSEVPDGCEEAARGVLDVLPESRTQVYDVRKILRLLVDTDSLFELKARFGRSIVTALSRIDGRSVGLLASNPLSKGGAIDVDACRKATSFLVLCDSFNMGGGRNADEVAAWPTADYGFMDPSVAVNVLFNVRAEDDPQRFKELVEEVQRDSSAWSLAGLYEAQSVIDPRATRDFIVDALDAHFDHRSGGIGEHLLANWPTSY